VTGVEEKKERLFWSLAEPLLERPGVSRGTMMGFPCLRLNGRFFASIDRDSKNLVVKLPADRVGDLHLEWHGGRVRAEPPSVQGMVGGPRSRSRCMGPIARRGSSLCLE
jgi:hypothetical protein